MTDAPKLRTLPAPPTADEDRPRLSALVEMVMHHRYEEAAGFLRAAKATIREVRTVVGDTNGRGADADAVAAALDAVLTQMAERRRKLTPQQQAQTEPESEEMDEPAPQVSQEEEHDG